MSEVNVNLLIRGGGGDTFSIPKNIKINQPKDQSDTI